MDLRKLGPEGHAALHRLLGYLNFSSGATDAQVLAAWNEIYGLVEQDCDKPSWQVVHRLLGEKLDELSTESDAFRDSSGARSALSLLFEELLPGYLEFHRDLLFHQPPQDIFRPFFVGRAAEMLLDTRASGEDGNRLVETTIARLNDHVGHRPVATLQTHRLEPYPHEWVRPVPLYVEAAGVDVGRYHDVVELALEILRTTDEDLLEEAYLDPDLLEELAFDPRAYDFEHPANKRPNYHFGQWDPQHIDNAGRYRRFVVQQVTLDALWQRAAEPGQLPADEMLYEAAAVLAGTVLMATGISGRGPETHDSETTLATLLRRIAAYRDQFYERLLEKLTGAHAARLQQEATELRQPFGAARQHLNAQLARRRATQLEHVHVAQVYARLGYKEAATRQADVVPAASARFLCRIDCHLSGVEEETQRGDFQAACERLEEVIELIHRGIGCGAIVDPWNMLGFDAHFSLFPAQENSIHDTRIDDLLRLMDQVYSSYSRLWWEAAASDNQELCQTISQRFQKTTQWWRQFAAHEVTSLGAVDSLEVYRAAERVADMLALWHRGGAAAGDVAFWAPHAEQMDSPQAYAAVIEALLEKRDFVASRALLAHWLGNADEVGLQVGGFSLADYLQRWSRELRRQRAGDEDDDLQRWQRLRKCLDYLEANGEHFWHAPQFGLSRSGQTGSHEVDLLEEEDEEDENPFSAAYEDFVFRDSTDDGMDSALFEVGEEPDDELEREYQRLHVRLDLLNCLAQMTTAAALDAAQLPGDAEERLESVRHWCDHVLATRRGLLELLDSVGQYHIARSGVDHDSLVQYDRRRMFKEMLLEQIIAAAVEHTHAAGAILAAMLVTDTAVQQSWDDHFRHFFDADHQASIELLSCLLADDSEGVRRRWPAYQKKLAGQPLLYIPLTKGGDAERILSARTRQRTIADLLVCMPKLGLLSETRELIETARLMERRNPVGAGAVTEFDGLFETGYRAMVRAVVGVVSEGDHATLNPKPRRDIEARDTHLIDCLEQLTESMLVSWLAHSRTLRLSIMENLNDEAAWKETVAFIQKYGDELFTQRFLNLGNLRAILHQGTDNWLSQLEESPSPDAPDELLEDLATGAADRDKVVEQLSLILEAIVEHYNEYRDYNSTTTQSDRGGMLYCLLDFLRLQNGYDRIQWNLKPVILAHEILIRGGLTKSAAMWRTALAERTSDEADRYQKRLRKLQKKYAMRMPTIADKIAERFVRPLLVDQVRSLVAPAAGSSTQQERQTAFDVLEQEIAQLISEPTGVGLDVPPWLAAIEDEVEQVKSGEPADGEDNLFAQSVPHHRLDIHELQRQLDQWVEDD